MLICLFLLPNASKSQPENWVQKVCSQRLNQVIVWELFPFFSLVSTYSLPSPQSPIQVLFICVMLIEHSCFMPLPILYTKNSGQAFDDSHHPLKFDIQQITNSYRIKMRKRSKSKSESRSIWDLRFLSCDVRAFGSHLTVWVVCVRVGVAAVALLPLPLPTPPLHYSLHHRHRIFTRRWDQWKCVLENSYMLQHHHVHGLLAHKGWTKTIPSWMVMEMMFCCCVCIISNYARCCSFTSEPLYFNCVAFSKFFLSQLPLCCLNPIRSDPKRFVPQMR